MNGGTAAPSFHNRSQYCYERNIARSTSPRDEALQGQDFIMDNILEYIEHEQVKSGPY